MEETTIKTEAIDMTPDISLFPKIGKSGYTLTQAIAELVDNSIDARQIGSLLKVNIIIQNDFIVVEDDGKGMNRDIAEKALKLGYSRKKNALGEFGLGLKSACTSIGAKFTIKTYPLKKHEGYEFIYDEDKWLSRTDSGWMDELRIFTKNENKQGTWIKIENPKRKINKQRKKDILLDFSKRFSPFIRTGEIEIFVNQSKCTPEAIELNKDGEIKFEIKISQNQKLCGWYGLMKKGSDKGQYGFTTFRRGRMITCYDKIGIPHHPTVSKIIGEIHMDHVPVSHSKKEFETESTEYKEAVELLTNEFHDIVKKARITSLASKVTENIELETEIWKSAIIESFHKNLKDIIDFPQNKKGTRDENDPIGEIEIEQRDPRLHDTIREIIEKNKHLRNPKDKRQIVVSHFITIAGKRYKVNHSFNTLGENVGWKVWSYTKDNATIDVLTNQDFPAYAITKDISFYAAIHIAESIAEIIGEINEFDSKKINEIKETLLRNASETLDQFREQINI